MAPFAGDLVASDMNLPVYDASASACPENYAENDAGVRCSAINGPEWARQFASFSMRIRRPNPHLIV